MVLSRNLYFTEQKPMNNTPVTVTPPVTPPATPTVTPYVTPTSYEVNSLPSPTLRKNKASTRSLFAPVKPRPATRKASRKNRKARKHRKASRKNRA